MDKKIIIAPSLLAADFSKLKEEITEVEKLGAEYLHLDVMDGNFVPNISFGAPVISSLRKHSNLVFDVHLMVNEPDYLIEDFSQFSDIITVHAEASKHLNRTIQLIKSFGKKVGVALNPSTPLDVIKYDLDNIDIEVDGGINDKTAKLVKEAGANVLVAGSYIFSGNYKEKIDSLK